MFFNAQFTSNQSISVNFLEKKQYKTFKSFRLQIKESMKTLSLISYLKMLRFEK